jgi:hypothetical protein
MRLRRNNLLYFIVYFILYRMYVLYQTNVRNLKRDKYIFKLAEKGGAVSNVTKKKKSRISRYE